MLETSRTVGRRAFVFPSVEGLCQDFHARCYSPSLPSCSNGLYLTVYLALLGSVTEVEEFLALGNVRGSTVACMYKCDDLLFAVVSRCLRSFE